MNILFLYKKPMIAEKGGVQRVTRTLAKGFEEVGYNIFYLSCSSEKHDITNQYELPDCKRTYSIENINYIINFIKENNISVVINQTGLGGTYGLLLNIVRLFCKNIKIISVVHNSPLGKLKSIEMSTSKSKLRFFNVFFKIYYFLKYSLKYHLTYVASNKLILLSDAYIEEVSFFLPFNRLKKVGSISNMSYLESDDCEYMKENIILYVGRLNVATKRVDKLIQIWSEIENEILDWKLFIVGAGPDEQLLKQLSKDNKLKNIEFIGFVDPTEYYKRAKIICLTSSLEGLPMVLIEAQSQGVIPVSYDSFGSLRDIVETRKNGFVVPLDDSDEFCETIIELANNDTLRKEISKNALLKSYSFSLDNIKNEWINLIKNL